MTAPAEGIPWEKDISWEGSKDNANDGSDPGLYEWNQAEYLTKMDDKRLFLRQVTA